MIVWLLKFALYLVNWRVEAIEHRINDNLPATRSGPRILALRSVWRNLADAITDAITEEQADD